MNAQSIFGIVAILYCVANLGSMGLELNLTETMNSARSAGSCNCVVDFGPLFCFKS